MLCIGNDYGGLIITRYEPLIGETMSRTLRQSKHGKVRDGKKNNEFVMKHDITPIRDSENQSFREEERQYFKKFKDTKYAQKPKSNGGSW